MGNNIQALLFDSGRVLNRSFAGNWFIPPDFFSYVDKQKFYTIPKAQRDLAFKKAGEYISSKNLIKTEEQEFIEFLQYYKVFFKNLPQIDIDDKRIELITRDLVYNYDKYIFFDDSKMIIPELSKAYKLAVVSDAWPSLENVFRKAGLRGYFQSFVISSVLGVRKPDVLMYSTALKELGVKPEEAIFIDDNFNNCDGAKKLGIQSFLLCRDTKMYWFLKIAIRRHKVIRNLNDLTKFLKNDT